MAPEEGTPNPASPQGEKGSGRGETLCRASSPSKPFIALKKQVLEVIFICFITQTLFYIISYASHCKPLPPLDTFRLPIYATQVNEENIQRQRRPL